MKKIQIINPIEYPGWDDLLRTNDQGTFFQTAAWAKVLAESYHYKPLYFVHTRNGTLSSLIPVMEVKSMLTGKRGISLPFTDYCRPIADSEDQLSRLLEKVIDYGKQAGWKHLELRGGMNYLNNSPASATFISHSLDLAAGEKQIDKSLRSSTRRNIKHAVREKVLVKFHNTLKATKSFYQLNSITRQYHGIPPQPFSFFRKVHEHIISRGKGIVAIAYHGNTPIAGGVFFHFDKKAIFKYGASLRSFHHLRPNNLLMWQVIRRYMQEDYRHFGFGKTEPHSKGLLQFKRGWGTREQIIHYHKYDLVKDCFVPGSAGPKTSYNFFKKMPVPLLKLAGNILYRHVG